ncbi:Defensin-like protein [Frankliniella fusca]|uniref:Defensin-like protein n=1 Tax=Frankliniella fusca TaxID=407009 RepID=A0AAE1LR14_9NEOP|nr:Defensin-like protein [Frankliniella fusca]
MSAKVLMMMALIALALVAVHAMPGVLEQRLAAESSTPSSTTPVNGGGGNGGTGGWCWSGSSCEIGCQRAGFLSGYCFFFRCYCSE